MSTPHPDDPRPGDGLNRPSAAGNTTESRALVPFAAPPRTELMLAAVANHANAVKGAPLDQKAILASIRRRWFPALSLGLLAALLSAGVAWMILPMPYTAYAELHIRSSPQKLIWDAKETGTQFDVYRQTQQRQVKSQFVLNAALRDPKISKLSTLIDEPHQLEWLEKNVSVTSPATEFLRVSLSGNEPKELAAIVNAITKAYLDEVANTQTNDRNKRISDLGKVHDELEATLRTRTATLKRLVKSLQTGDPLALTEKQKMMMEMQAALRKQRAQMQFELMNARIKLAAKEDGSLPADQVDIPEAVVESHLYQDPEAERAAAAVEAQQRGLVLLEKATSSKDKRVLAARKDLDAAKKNFEEQKVRLRPLIAERLRTEIRGKTEASAAQLRETARLTEMTIKTLDEEMDKQKFETQQTGEMTFEVEQIREDLMQTKSIDQRINEEIERLKIEQKAESRVVKYRDAETPNHPDFEKKLRLVGMSGFSALALIVACIVWFDIRTQRINSLEDVSTGLRLPILGSLPTVPRQAGSGKSRTATAKADIWQGSMMESIDSARVMLLRRAELENAKVAMIVSAMMSEGKTTLSCHLATSLARAGYRTLLIDSDIRRPTVHRVFDIPCEPGVCELLRKEVELVDVISPTPQDGLFVLPAGSVTQEALRELAQDALNPLMARLREEYDFIIVDSSPILPVTDSLLISQYVDGVIFSIRRDVSQYPKVATACQRLAMIGVPLWGAVVIGLDQMSYGYQYAYAYGAVRKGTKAAGSA